MSLIDAVISRLDTNAEAVRECATQVAGTKSTLEDIATQFASLAAHGKTTQTNAAIAQCDHILATLETIATQLEQTQTKAHTLKTTGGAAASSANHEAQSKFEVTTGLERRPTPLEAAPTHLREPAAKVADPVKPVETEPGKDIGMSRARRLGRKSVRGMDDLKEFAEEVAHPYSEPLLDNFDPWGKDSRTESHLTAAPAQLHSPQHQESSTPDIIGTMVFVTAAGIEASSRIWDRFRQSRRASKETTND
ncbi:hypothetical protein [Natronoglycomyces albus]|uniref:Uncharacterized protein n=1 Tax=Natronoglycomyces albus TaxID=2811108 RepID=A0A895XTJ3_9ACTN|nr:hypothetical protein [Natronoglycomyces albus]QSB04958.1 hypothetical protein JQS30_14520 [Natronoglycomyces albus]